MNLNLNESERELVRLANYFSKNAQLQNLEENFGEEHAKLVDSCHQIVSALNKHAEYRATVLAQRDALAKAIKDNADCPQCNQNTQLKLVGVDNSMDMSCNRYKCRRCNISFTWNRPNNPWDFVKFIDGLQVQIVEQLQEDSLPEEEVQLYQQTIQDLGFQRNKLQESIAQVDENYSVMQQKEAEMSALVQSFSKYLKITKIQMEV